MEQQNSTNRLCKLCRNSVWRITVAESTSWRPPKKKIDFGRSMCPFFRHTPLPLKWFFLFARMAASVWVKHGPKTYWSGQNESHRGEPARWSMQEGKQKTQKPQKHKPQNQKTNPTQKNTPMTVRSKLAVKHETYSPPDVDKSTTPSARLLAHAYETCSLAFIQKVHPVTKTKQSTRSVWPTAAIKSFPSFFPWFGLVCVIFHSIPWFLFAFFKCRQMFHICSWFSSTLW